VNGYIDSIPVADVTRFESALLADVRANHGGILSAIRDSRDLSDDTRDKLKAMLDQFVKTFA
jgi:F-type H+-transporting ATPase subunit alpha